jgi:hypothetical protein
LPDHFQVIPPDIARRHKRAAGSAGTSFYIARGLPFVTMKQYRERRRDPDSQVAVELSRELTRLADSFPRFRLALNRLQHHVLVQVRSPGWKQKAILECLPHEKGISIREICNTSGLDFTSVARTLGELRTTGAAVACNRAGRTIAIAGAGVTERRDHERTAKVYWRRGT